jgi:hypothetical protein
VALNPTAPPSDTGNTVAAYGGPPTPPPAVPVAASTGRTEIGAISVTGGTVPNVESAVAAMRAGFQTCFVRGQAARPDAEGEVTLTIRLGAAGQILGVAAQQTAKVPATVVSCMTTRAAASQFDPPAGAKSQVKVVVPVTLTKP